MADTDGKIQLAVELSPEDVKKSAQKLQKSIQNIFSQVSGQKLDSQFQKLLSNMSKGISRSESLQKALEKVSNQQIETKEYTKLQKEVDSLTEKIDNAKVKQAQFLEGGGKEGSRAYQNMNYNIAMLEDKLFDAERELSQLVAEGKQFTINEDGVETAKNALADSNNQLRLMLETAAEYQGKQSEIAQQHSQEVDAQAQQIAKLLEIKLNAGEINSEIGETIERLQEIRSELAELQARQAELEAAGVGLGYEEYDRNLHVIRELTDEQSRLNEEVAQYRTEQEEGGTVTYTVWERVGNLFKQIGYDLLHPIERIQELRAGTEESGKAANSAVSGFSKLAATVARMAGSFITSVSGIKKFTNALSAAAGKSQSASFSFKKLFTTLLRYGIGIRSIYALFNKLRHAITENIQYYALWNNGMNQTNAAISTMQSSLNALKGALAGAFVPIITTVAPMLSSLVDQLASVVTAIGMFIAKLTGAKSYMKAVKKNTNYAAGLSSGGGSSGSNKKSPQEKYEEAVAKAQKKYEDQLSKTREKNSKAEAKAEEKQAKAADKLAKAQKRANGELSSLDKLNVINAQDMEELEEIQADLYDEPELNLPSLEDYMDALTGGGGAGGGAPFDMVEVPLDNIQWNWDDLKTKAEELGKGIADKLNKFFENEDLAKKIGKNIAEALNTAVRFARGFVKQLDWKQLGRWLGTLVKEGITTFEWDTLGETLGLLLNGLADSIRGFFERYPVGTLGSSIATMINNAIKTIKADDLGIAVSDLLKAPFIELSSFFKETNWNDMGKKLSEFLHNAFTSKELNDKTLGETIGQTLGDMVNAGVEFLKGSDVRTIVADLVTFFSDIISTAIAEIKWADLLKGLWDTIIGVLVGLVQGVIEGVLDIILGIAQAIMDAIIDYLEKKYPLMKGELEKVRQDIHDSYAQMKDDIHTQLDEAGRETEAFFTGNSTAAANSATAVEESSKRFNTAIGSMTKLMNDWSSGTAVNWDSALKNMQTELGFTDEDMDTLIGTFASMDEKFNDSDEILTGYTGSWEEYKKTISDASGDISTATNTTTKDVTNSFGDMEKNVNSSIDSTAKNSSDKFKKIVESAEKTLKKDKFTQIGQNGVMGGLESAIKQTGKVTSAANQASNIITNTFRNRLTATVLMPVGGNLISGLVNGMMSRLRSALTSIGSICNQITAKVKATFDEHSPSKVFAEIGKNLMLGLEGGVEDNADGVTDSFEDLVPSNDMLNNFYIKYISTMSSLTNSVSDMFDGMSEHITDSLTGLTTLERFKNFKGNMSLSSMGIPAIAQGYRLPSSLELTNNGDTLSAQLPGMLKSAMLAALQESSSFDLTEKSIIINIDGKNVFEAVRNQNTKYKKQHGTSAFG